MGGRLRTAACNPERMVVPREAAHCKEPAEAKMAIQRGQRLPATNRPPERTASLNTESVHTGEESVPMHSRALDPVLMHLSFLLPSIHKRHTGGNIYNRRIIAELSNRISVNARPWQPNVEAAAAVCPSSPRAPMVVDSLFLRHPSSLRSLRRNHDGPLVLMAHYLHCVDPTEHDTEQADAERGILSVFDGGVTTSRYVQHALAAQDVPVDDIWVVPPGLDAEYRAPLPASSPDPPTILTVANVVPGKGLAGFARRLASLPERDWQWHLVGDDTLDSDAASRLRAALRTASIADRVTGPHRIPPDEMRAQYDHADVFVLPSRFETCSMATREALARGCPVLGYEVGGMAENLGDAATRRGTLPPRGTAASSNAASSRDAPAGHLVPPDAPDALIDALRTLLTAPSTRADMRAAARERSRAFPTWAAAADQFHSALQSFQPPRP